MTIKKRLRMFAGPNGSGKSTVKNDIESNLLGFYINPDEIEKEILDTGFIDFGKYEIQVEQHELFEFLQKSSFLQQINLVEKVKLLKFSKIKYFLKM